MEQKKEKKDQFVIAYITHLDNTETVVTHAQYLATMLNKGLILLHVSDPQYTSITPSEAGEKLKALSQTIPQCTYAALKGETKVVIGALPDLLNAVVIVAHADKNASRKTPTHYKEVLKNFSECKVAYLTVQQQLSAPRAYGRVGFTIDYKKESKEKFIWVSYFARFNQSKLFALYPEYRDEGFLYKRKANFQFLTKLYENLGIGYERISLGRTRAYVDLEALDYGSHEHYDLMVSVTTKEKDIAELFVKTQEERSIVNSYMIPILFLNPRDDLFVLCD